MIIANFESIHALKLELRTYDDVTNAIRKRKQRILHVNPEAAPSLDTLVKDLVKIKLAISRKIEKLLEEWPIWTEWLKFVPGVGPFVAGNLVMLYYYRHVPICSCGEAVEKRNKTFYCPACDKSIKGDGIVRHKIEERDFATVSKWWAFMGRRVEDGKMPKRKKGVQANWSNLGRAVSHQFGDQVNRQPANFPYKAFFLERKAKREKTHPEATKGHRHNMARNETIKLFLSHFWHVARTLSGKDTRGPYAEVVLRHDGIIAPYYWKNPSQKKAA